MSDNVRTIDLSTPVVEEVVAPEAVVTAPEVVVTAPVVETPPVPEHDSMAARFAALSRKEKAIVERERLLKDQYETKVTAWEKAQQSAKLNPVEFLKSVGLEFADVANFMMHGEQPTPELQYRHLEDKVAQMEQARIKEREDQENAARQAEIQAQKEFETRTRNGYKETITSYLASNSDNLELSNQLESVDLIFDFTEQYYNETGEILPLDTAAQIVEDYWESEVERVMQLKKVQSKYGNRKEESEQQESLVRAERPSVTISNRMGNTPTVVQPIDRTGMTKEEYFEAKRRQVEEKLNREFAKK